MNRASSPIGPAAAGAATTTTPPTRALRAGPSLLAGMQRFLFARLVLVLTALWSFLAALDLLSWVDAFEAAFDAVEAWVFSRLLGYELRFPVHKQGGVLVTGADAGIGAHAAVTLAKRGFTVFAGVRSLPDGHRLKQHLSPETETNLIPIVIDITNQSHIEQSVRDIQFRLAQHTFGPLESRQLVGIVNCGGVPYVAPMEAATSMDFMNVLHANTVGPMALVQAFLPMLRQSKGRVINVSSVTGMTASPMHGVYAASKMALEAATDSLRVEVYNWGISVSLIEPGSVDTRLWSHPSASASASSHRRQPSAGGRAPTPILSPVQTELYGPLIKSVETINRETSGNMLSPEHSTRAIVHALTTQFPRTRYLVGFDAKMTGWMRWVFSDRMLDWGFKVLISQAYEEQQEQQQHQQQHAAKGPKITTIS